MDLPFAQSRASSTRGCNVRRKPCSSGPSRDNYNAANPQFCEATWKWTGLTNYSLVTSQLHSQTGTPSCSFTQAQECKVARARVSIVFRCCIWLQRESRSHRSAVARCPEFPGVVAGGQLAHWVQCGVEGCECSGCHHQVLNCECSGTAPSRSSRHDQLLMETVL